MGTAVEGFTREEVEQATSVITCDLNGMVETFSRGAEKLFGYDPDEVIGNLSVAVFHLPEKVEELVPRLLKTAVEEGLFEEDVVLVKKGGAQFRARLAVRPIHRERKLVGYMGLTRPLE